MAKKKKRTNNWAKIKGFLWREQKERGVYKYNSPNFNKAVTEVYNELGKKMPRNKSHIAFIFERAEHELFEEPGGVENIEYYNIDRALSSYQGNSAYQAYNVVTNFGGAYPDVELSLADYEYQGSVFQEIVTAADQMRRDRGMSQTPERKLKIEVDKRSQTIRIYVADQAPPKGEKTIFKEVAKTPKTIEAKTKEKEKIDSRINEIDSRMKGLESVLVKIASSGKEFMASADPILQTMRELRNEKNQLQANTKEIDKFLGSAAGFGSEKKMGKKRAKKGAKGTGTKRKRK